MKLLSAKTDEQLSQGVLHRNSVCGVDRGIAAVVFFCSWRTVDRDQRECHQDVGSTWLVSCRNSPTPARDVAAFALHTQRRQFEFLLPWWLALGAPVGCFARRPATESATKSMRVIRLADGAVRVGSHLAGCCRLALLPRAAGAQARHVSAGPAAWLLIRGGVRVGVGEEGGRSRWPGCPSGCVFY